MRAAGAENSRKASGSWRSRGNGGGKRCFGFGPSLAMICMAGNAVKRLLGAGVLWLAAGPVAAGVVFREAENIDADPAGGAARQIRQVLAEADNCKVLLEESSDTLMPVGAYVLASGVDAFLVDPAARTIAPMDPISMVPVTAMPADAATRARILDVTLEQQFDAAGQPILGLPTRHLVYQLRYQEVAAGADAAGPEPTRRDERHEIWVTPWPEGDAAPVAWQLLRIAEDAGPGPDRQDIRDALEQIYQHGLVLRQLIERRTISGAVTAQRVEIERVTREVSSVGRQDLPPAVFEKPVGYAQTEFLAPEPADLVEAATGEKAGAPAAPKPPGE